MNIIQTFAFTGGFSSRVSGAYGYDPHDVKYSINLKPFDLSLGSLTGFSVDTTISGNETATTTISKSLFYGPDGALKTTILPFPAIYLTTGFGVMATLLDGSKSVVISPPRDIGGGRLPGTVVVTGFPLTQKLTGNLAPGQTVTTTGILSSGDSPIQNTHPSSHSTLSPSSAPISTDSLSTPLHNFILDVETDFSIPSSYSGNYYEMYYGVLFSGTGSETHKINLTFTYDYTPYTKFFTADDDTVDFNNLTTSQLQILSSSDLYNSLAGNDTVILPSASSAANLGGSGASFSLTTQFIMGDGNDTVTGADASYNLALGNGKDVVGLGNGNNIVVVGNGNDIVSVGNGNNTLRVGDGNSTITVGSGNNAVTLGSGSDTVSIGSGLNVSGSPGGVTSVTLGSGADTINLGGPRTNLVLSTGTLTAAFTTAAQALTLSGLTPAKAPTIGNFVAGDSIDLMGIVADRATYDPFTRHVLLSRGQSTGTELTLADLAMTVDTVRTTTVLAPDGTGGTMLTLVSVKPLFTSGADVVSFNSLLEPQKQAVAAGADIYNALGGGDTITLPDQSAASNLGGTGKSFDPAQIFLTGDGGTTVKGGDLGYRILLGTGSNSVTLGDGVNTIADHVLFSTTANNNIAVGTGTNTINLGDGNNFVGVAAGGSTSTDTITVGDGSNYVYGGTGPTIIKGGTGENTFISSSAVTTLTGQGSTTTFQVLSGNTINGFASGDVIDLKVPDPTKQIDTAVVSTDGTNTYIMAFDTSSFATVSTITLTGVYQPTNFFGSQVSGKDYLKLTYSGRNPSTVFQSIETAVFDVKAVLDHALSAVQEWKKDFATGLTRELLLYGLEKVTVKFLEIPLAFAHTAYDLSAASTDYFLGNLNDQQYEVAVAKALINLDPTGLGSPIATVGSFIVSRWIDKYYAAIEAADFSEPKTAVVPIKVSPTSSIRNPKIIGAQLTPLATITVPNASDPLVVSQFTDAAFSVGSVLTIDQNGQLSYRSGTVTAANAGANQLHFTITDTATGSKQAVTIPVTLQLAPDPLFDPAFYLAKNPDVAAAGIDPLLHYLTNGYKEGRDPSATFSTSYYLKKNSDVASAGLNPLLHFETSGYVEGRNPSATFNLGDYLAANPDVKAAGINPLLHYVTSGRGEGRSAFPVGPTPEPLFDTAYYYARNPDVKAAGLDAYAHYLSSGFKEGRAPDAYFDAKYYLTQNPDVAAAGLDPLAHFLSSGYKEGREPSLLFSDAKYLAANADVKAAGLNPLAHYLSSGQAEGRMAFLTGGTAAADPLVNAAYYDPQLGATLIPTGTAAAQQAAASYDATGWQKGLNPDAFFDTNYYLSHNADVSAAHINPLLHYETSGWREGRDPSATFSTNKYLAAYGDVKNAGLDPLLHYVAYGQGEGRTAFSA